MKKQAASKQSVKNKNNSGIPVKNAGRDSFFRFMMQKSQLLELLFITIGLTAVYLLIYYWYPTPCSYYDTNNYLTSAEAKSFGGYRPYGYSWFLVFVKGFSPTMHAVYFFQFFLNYLASVFFIFTIKYVFGAANKIVSWLFTLFVLCSPAILYMTNYIMSDSIFISLTVIWLTSCIWILYNKSIANVVLHFFSLFALIHVRYSGLFYPAFSIAIFIFSFKAKPFLAFTFSAVTLLIGWQLYSYNKTKMKKLVNVDVFSGFSGWQLANNAMHMIPYIDLKPEEITDPEQRRIHEYVLALPDSTYKQNGITAAYIWFKEYPLKQYMYKTMEENNRYYLRAWALSSIEFGKYGSMLIKKYPGAFLQHYLLPNIKEAIYPSSCEALASYTVVWPENKWFVQQPGDYKQPANDVFNTRYARILPVVAFVQWLLVFASLILGIVFRKRIRFTQAQRMIFFIFLLFGVAYMAFNIYATPFAIRYLLPIHALQIALIFILLMCNTKKIASSQAAE